MNTSRNGSRQFFLALLVLLVVAWVSGEATQWILRNRAQHLLADIQAINVDRSRWADVQPTMQRWSKWSSTPRACTADSCDYRISIEQSLPRILVGNPNNGIGNWLPRLVDRTGLRSTAARGGFTVEHGVVTAKWFGEQVTLPVADWEQTTGYIPYLSVLSGESSKFHVTLPGPKPLHPNRMVQPINNYLVVSFTPDEDPSEKAQLMDFRLTCITQLTPCHSEREILPEAWRMLQEKNR
jgi:hypothetical protein